jgi:hypothetical protein
VWRRHREPGLVLEDDPGIERRRGASTCGHTSFFQSSTACSSHSSARRAGLCQDQPWRCRSRHTPAIEQLTLNWRPISILTRSSVHRWSSQPCAMKRLLSTAAMSVTRKKDCYLSADYRRIAARRGRPRTLVAVMHKLAVAIWHILRHKTRYQDLGADSFTRRDPEHAMRPMTKEANRLGLTVRFEPIAATA